MQNPNRFLWIGVAGLLANCLICGCNSAGPNDSGTDGSEGGRKINDNSADTKQFDPDGFMGGFQGSPTP